MKKTILVSMVLLFSMITQAGTIQSKALKIEPSSIDKVIRLVEKRSEQGSTKKLSIVVTDNGMSTDVSPRYKIYLGFASLAEMGNISADFKISDQALNFISATRKSAGVYEVKTIEYRDGGDFEITQTIDATKVFSDEKKLRESLDQFGDETLKTSIVVTETAKKL